MTHKKGFTLVELLVVIAIIGILAGLIIANLSTARAKARDAKRKSDLRAIQTALEMYYDDNNKYPGREDSSTGWTSTSQIGNLLVNNGYLSKMPTDYSGNGYAYMRKDDAVWSGCFDIPILSAARYSLYAKLEKPTATDGATFNQDTYEQTIGSCFTRINGLNYRVGN